MIITDPHALGLAAAATALAMLSRRMPWIAAAMAIGATCFGVAGFLGH